MYPFLFVCLLGSQGRSCFNVTPPLVPGLHSAFLTEPEVEIDFLKGLSTLHVKEKRFQCFSQHSHHNRKQIRASN